MYLLRNGVLVASLCVGLALSSDEKSSWKKTRKKTVKEERSLSQPLFAANASGVSYGSSSVNDMSQVTHVFKPQSSDHNDKNYFGSRHGDVSYQQAPTRIVSFDLSSGKTIYENKKITKRKKEKVSFMGQSCFSIWGTHGYRKNKPDLTELTIRFLDLFRFYSEADEYLFQVGWILQVARSFNAVAYMFFLTEIVAAVSEEDLDDAYHRLVLVSVGFGCLGVWTLINKAGAEYSFRLAAERADHRNRYVYFNALLGRDITFYDTSIEKFESLSSNMERHLEEVTKATSSYLPNLIYNVSCIVIMLGIALYYSYIVALIYLSVSPVLILVLFYYKNFTKNSSTRSLTVYAKAGRIAQEVFKNLRTVIAFGMEEEAVRRYTFALRDSRQEVCKSVVVTEAMYGVVACAVGMCSACLLYGGQVLIPENRINPKSGEPYSPSDVVVAIFAIGWVFTKLKELVDSFNIFTNSMQAVAPMYEIINSPTIIEPVHEYEYRTPLPPQLDELIDITFQDVDFVHPSQPGVKVLNGLTLNIRAGEKVALVGEGTSAIFQLLQRFYDPLNSEDSNEEVGSITVNGMDLCELPVISWRSVIGYVGKDPALCAVSIMENIRLGNPLATNEKVQVAALMVGADEFISSLPYGYETNSDELIGETALSDGEKQLIAIARALVRNPKILILDNATSGLDASAEEAVQATLDRLVEDRDLIVITVTHKLSTICCSDKIFFLSEGRVSEVGSHEELMNLRGLYYAMVQSSQQPKDGPRLTSQNDDGASRQPTQESHSSIQLKVDGPTNLQDISIDFIKRRLRANRKEVSESSVQQERQVLIIEEGGYQLPTNFDRKLFSFTKDRFWIPQVFASALISSISYPFYGYIAARSVDILTACEGSRDDNGYVPENSIFTNEDCFEDLNDITRISILAAINGVVASVCFIVLGMVAGYIKGEIVSNIRSAVLSSLLKQDCSYHEHSDHSGDILSSRLATSAVALTELMDPLLLRIPQISSTLIVGFVLAIYFSIPVTSICFLGIPAIMVLGRFVPTLLAAKNTKKSLYTKASSFAAEGIHNVRNIRSLNAQNSILKFYGKLIADPHESILKQLVYDSILSAYWPSFTCFANCMAYGCCALLVKHDYATVVEVFGTHLCVFITLEVVQSRLSNWPDVPAGQLASFDLFTIIDKKSRMDTTGTVKEILDGLVVFDNVNFNLPHSPNVNVLQGVSFSVTLGSSIGLVGPGTGKSIILQLLLRFYEPSLAGSISISGTDLRKLDLSWWRNNLGLVQREPVLFDLSVEDNIRYGKPNATKVEILKAAELAKIDFVGDGKTCQWFGSVLQLSNGQKQRIALARAILRNPKFLLLDEITSDLDSESEYVIQQALDQVVTGRTTFVVSSKLTNVARCDEILVFDHGVLVEQGTYDELSVDCGLFAIMLQEELPKMSI